MLKRSWTEFAEPERKRFTWKYLAAPPNVITVAGQPFVKIASTREFLRFAFKSTPDGAAITSEDGPKHTLISSIGYQMLIRQRNLECFSKTAAVSSDDAAPSLFKKPKPESILEMLNRCGAGDATPDPLRKPLKETKTDVVDRRKSPMAVNITVPAFTMDDVDYPSQELCVLSAGHPREALHVKEDAESVGLVATFMRAHGFADGLRRVQRDTDLPQRVWNNRRGNGKGFIVNMSGSRKRVATLADAVTIIEGDGLPENGSDADAGGGVADTAVGDGVADAADVDEGEEEERMSESSGHEE